MSNCIFF